MTAIDTTVEKIAESGVTDEYLERSVSFTAADAIRMGSQHSEQAYNWGSGETACALTAAGLAAKAAKYV